MKETEILWELSSRHPIHRQKNKNQTDPCGCEIAAIRKNEGWFAKDQGWQATKPSFWGANDWRSKTVLAIFMGVGGWFCKRTAAPCA
ncbi:MAG: hypothetical protein DWI02_05470 [Planctomycetota bacterium]|nr:MAG: hypothetical protein DWI02_05470 [Planctomycetota bacterium]